MHVFTCTPERLRANGPGDGRVRRPDPVRQLLMVGMVAAMKGFNGAQGTELAEVIISKVKQAVSAISFR